MRLANHRIGIAALMLALTIAVGGALSPMPSRADAADELQRQMDQLSKEESRLRRELAAYKSDAAKQQEYADSLQEQIRNTEKQIDLLRRQTDMLSEEVAAKSADIESRQAAIDATRADMADSLCAFGERLRTIVRSGQVTGVQMLLDTDGFVDYLLRNRMITRLAQSDQEMMDELDRRLTALNAEKATLQEDVAALQAEQAHIEELKAAADEKMAQLDDLYAESKQVLDALQNSVEDAGERLAQKQREAQLLDEQIRRLIEENKRTTTATTTTTTTTTTTAVTTTTVPGGTTAPGDPTATTGGGTTTTTAPTGGTTTTAPSGGEQTGNPADPPMYWPVPVVHSLSRGYGMDEGVMHRGIDIANGKVRIYGQDVIAAADGEVIYTNTSGWGGGYGLFIMVDHGYDSRGRHIVTLYAHLSEVLVSKGDKVTGGKTVIGRAGSTGDSTGPHLHFEVRVDGTAVDPIANGYVSM